MFTNFNTDYPTYFFFIWTSYLLWGHVFHGFYHVLGSSLSSFRFQVLVPCVSWLLLCIGCQFYFLSTVFLFKQFFNTSRTVLTHNLNLSKTKKWQTLRVYLVDWNRYCNVIVIHIVYGFFSFVMFLLQGIIILYK